MELIKIQFLEEGTWGDHPADPLFDVEAGEICEVSAGLANTAVEAGKAEFVDSEQEADIGAEKAEKERVEAIQSKIQGFNLQEILGDELISGQLNSDLLKGVLEYLKGAEIDESFEEFAPAAQEMQESSIETLTKWVGRAEQAEADAAELEAFRKEKAAGPAKKAEGKSVKKKAEGK